MRQRIRLTESDLHRIIKESIKRVLNEDVYGQGQEDLIRQQYALKKKALDYLMRFGYKEWSSSTYQDNPFILAVSINDYRDVDKIKSMLTRYLGVTSEYDLSVNHDSNMFGNDQRAIIHLPTPNKLSQNI